jgi:hypothetical protein
VSYFARSAWPLIAENPQVLFQELLYAEAYGKRHSGSGDADDQRLRDL